MSIVKFRTMSLYLYLQHDIMGLGGVSYLFSFACSLLRRNLRHSCRRLPGGLTQSMRPCPSQVGIVVPGSHSCYPAL